MHVIELFSLFSSKTGFHFDADIGIVQLIKLENIFCSA